ncbi:hypothetical protein FB45DRAFT_960179 [Roridomyces roridus]|uniref:Uncharacterized protein n=1 Tax=Roridomyces roridus TaxID=1738132 RepID=A0AAD7AXM6_9AGAR|nr:hypothetical protein FB45DRAFT_960179 [Roridomyces roridus]
MSNDIRALLNLPENEEVDSGAVTALILSATTDEKSPASLDKIYTALSQSPSGEYLDPLSILPHLVPCSQPAAKSLITLVGEQGSAKEVVIAAQEILERVNDSLDAEDDDDEDGALESPSNQLISLICLYNSAIPRLALRKKSASDTIRPLLLQLESSIQLAGSRFSRDEGRQVIATVSQLCSTVAAWAKDDAAACQGIAKELLETTLSSCAQCIQSSLAQRSFEELYPRLTIRSTVLPGWEDGERPIQEALTVHRAFGETFSVDSVPSMPSTAYLVLLAHSKPSDTGGLLPRILPILIASIQSNYALDEALSILLHSTTSGRELSPDISGPLCAILPSLASAHPDSDIRHQAFRILSRVLALTSPALRLEILKDLTTDSDLPQMRVAAVGLVKEAVLESLPREDRASIFASPIFLQTLGPVLLRPDPPDLFHPDLSLKDIEDSAEPSRLVECLSLYYILLLRDNLNRTGIRDRDQISNVEKTLLAPLRSTLARWTDNPAFTHGHIHDMMPVVSLKTSLERVDAAISNLRADSKV